MRYKDVDSEVAYCIWKIGGKKKAMAALNVDRKTLDNWLTKGIMEKGEHAAKLAKLSRRYEEWLTEVDEFEELTKLYYPELYVK